MVSINALEKKHIWHLYLLWQYAETYLQWETLIQDKLQNTYSVYIASCEIYICVNFMSKHDFMVNMLTYVFENLTRDIWCP